MFRYVSVKWINVVWDVCYSPGPGFPSLVPTFLTSRNNDNNWFSFSYFPSLVHSRRDLYLSGRAKSVGDRCLAPTATALLASSHFASSQENSKEHCRMQIYFRTVLNCQKTASSMFQNSSSKSREGGRRSRPAEAVRRPSTRMSGAEKGKERIIPMLFWIGDWLLVGVWEEMPAKKNDAVAFYSFQTKVPDEMNVICCF